MNFAQNILLPAAQQYAATGTLPNNYPMLTKADIDNYGTNVAVVRTAQRNALLAAEATDPLASLVSVTVKEAFYELANSGTAIGSENATDLGDVSNFTAQVLVLPLMNLAAKAMVAVSTTGVDLTQPLTAAAVLTQVSKVYALAGNVTAVIQQKVIDLAYRLQILADIVSHGSQVTTTNSAVYSAITTPLQTLLNTVLTAVYGTNNVTNNVFTTALTNAGTIVNLVNQISLEINSFVACPSMSAYSDASNNIRQTGAFVDTYIQSLLGQLTVIETAFTTFNANANASAFFAILAQTTTSGTNSADLGASVSGSPTASVPAFTIRNSANFIPASGITLPTLPSLTATVSTKNILMNSFQFTGCDVQTVTSGIVNYESVKTYLDLFVSSTTAIATQKAALVNPVTINTIAGLTTAPNVNTINAMAGLAANSMTATQLSLQTVSDPTLYGAVPASSGAVVSDQTFTSDVNGILTLGAPLWGANALQTPTHRANNVRNFLEATFNVITANSSISSAPAGALVGNIATQVNAVLAPLTAAQQIAKIELFARPFFASVANQSTSQLNMTALWLGLTQAFGLDSNNNLAGTAPLPQTYSTFVGNMVSQASLTAEESTTAAASMKCGLGGSSDRSDVTTKFISNFKAQQNLLLPPVAAPTSTPNIGTAFLATALTSLRNI